MPILIIEVTPPKAGVLGEIDWSSIEIVCFIICVLIMFNCRKKKN